MERFAGSSISQTAGAGKATLAGIMLFAYLVTKPFYLFPSGGPQIADGFIALLFVWAIFSGTKLVGQYTSVLISCVYFLLYAFLVNAFWALALGDFSMLITPVFYFFNVIIMLVIFTLDSINRERALKVLMAGTVFALVLQTVLSLAIIGLGSRAVGYAARSDLFFNNPNQLGYWGLLIVSAFCVLTRMVKVRLVWHLLMFAMGFYLVALSLGKAATISLGILFAIHFARKWWHLALGTVVCLALLFALHDQPILHDLSARLSNIGQQQDDSLAGRGYMRIWNHPGYLLLGAGELGFSRFPLESHELHSTLGTLLFSYGVVGLSLFLGILFKMYKQTGMSNFLYLAPTFIYGLTHQGLRFSMLWVLLAVLAINARERESTRSRTEMRNGIPNASIAAGSETK